MFLQNPTRHGSPYLGVLRWNLIFCWLYYNVTSATDFRPFLFLLLCSYAQLRNVKRLFPDQCLPCYMLGSSPMICVLNETAGCFHTTKNMWKQSQGFESKLVSVLSRNASGHVFMGLLLKAWVRDNSSRYEVVKGHWEDGWKNNSMWWGVCLQAHKMMKMTIFWSVLYSKTWTFPLLRFKHY